MLFISQTWPPEILFTYDCSDDLINISDTISKKVIETEGFMVGGFWSDF